MGSPYEDGCILPLPGGRVQKGHPLNEGTVLRTPLIRVLAGWVVGGDPDNRTSSGLWPSDHGGAVVALRLR